MKQGQGWPLHGALLGLAVMWCRVRAGLYVEQCQDWPLILGLRWPFLVAGGWPLHGAG
jgi:hypothetical protein